MKYIDADKLTAEIKRRKYEWQAILDKNNAVNSKAIKNAIYEDENILDFITSLQQEQLEVDLEADIDKQIDECWNDYATTGGFNWKGFALHFYERGLNAAEKLLKLLR